MSKSTAKSELLRVWNNEEGDYITSALYALIHAFADKHGISFCAACELFVQLNDVSSTGDTSGMP